MRDGSIPIRRACSASAERGRTKREVFHRAPAWTDSGSSSDAWSKPSTRTCRSVSIVPTTTSEKSWPRCSAIISQCSAENETAPVGKTGAAYFIHLVAHGGRNQMQYADYQKSYDLATGF